MFVAHAIDMEQPYHAPSRSVYKWKETDGNAFDGTLSLLSQKKKIFRNFQVDCAYYHFYTPVTGYYSYERAESGRYAWLFTVPQFGDFFHGQGDTPSSAKEDWEEAFHQHFQDAYAHREFQLDSGQAAMWKAFEDTVDIQQYQERMPLTVAKIGKIFQKRGTVSTIHWIDGTSDVIKNSSQTHPDFFTFRLGEYFEATMQRDFRTNHLIKILVCSPSSYRDLTPTELDAFIDSLPSSRDLPTVNF